MKNIIYIILLVIISSCAKEKIMFNNDISRLEFVKNEKITHSFVNKFSFKKIKIKNKEVDVDTVFIEIRTVGSVPPKDRAISIEQITEKDEKGKNLKNTAESGKHYIAFDDPELKKLFVIKAGKTTAKIPIVLIRHPDLQEVFYRLKIKIKENANFKLAEQKTSEQLIIFSDFYIQPTAWFEDGYIEDEFFGPYGQEKHKFMTKTLGFKIDNEFFQNLLSPESPTIEEVIKSKEIIEDDEYGDYVQYNEMPSVDGSRIKFYLDKLNKALTKYNTNHPEKPLKEKAKEDETEGRFVEFPQPW
jgi:hypothetical protein